MLQSMLQTESKHASKQRTCLPRPVFNMASGTTFTINTKEEMETSPIFPARVEIIQGGGFEKPQLSSHKDPDQILADFHGARGAARGRYLNAGL